MAPTEESTSTTRILVVEDSPTQAEHLRTVLADTFDVRVAADGQQALSLFGAEDFDLVLTDVVMPVLSGYELCRRIKAGPRRHVPVILLAELSDPDAIVRGIECGADAFIPKPYRPLELIERIRGLLLNQSLRKSKRLSGGVEVQFLGKKFTISSEKEQIIDLLLSTCEEVIGSQQALRASQKELRAAKAQLEEYNRELRGQVRASGEKYRALMAHANDAKFILDPCGNVLEINRRAEELLDRPGAEIVGFPFAGLLVRHGDRDWLPKLLAGESIRADDILLTRDGADSVWVDLSASSAEVGDERFLLVIARDISRKREAEGVLRVSEARFRALVEQSYDGVMLLDGDGTVLYVSPSAGRIGGRAPAEYVGRKIYEWKHPDEAASHAAGLRELARHPGGSMAGEARFLHADGSWRWIESTFTNLLADPAVGAVVVNFRDVTERKRAEEARDREQVFLEAVMESIEEAVVACDARGTITYMNASTHLLREPGPLQFPLAEWGEHFRVYHPDRKTPMRNEEMPLYRALAGERVHDVELVLSPSQGKTHVLLASGQPLLDAQGKKLGAVVALHDITDRRRLEEQYLQAQKMEAFGQLAGGVAHDFNNLLTIINGYGELVCDSLRAGDPNREHLGEITRAGERAAALTRQLLAFSRRQVIAPTVLDLNAVVADAEKMLGRLIGEDIDLVFKPQPDLGRVQADAGLVEQVLMNLAVNARDAMPNGGKLTVETRNVELDEKYAAWHADARPGRHALLTVSDDGCGMTEAVRLRIFEPFFTTKDKGRGTGLGLAMVFGFVKQSGGHVEVYSEPGVGTSFKIYLPRVEAVLPARKSNPGLIPTHGGHETILLAEDEDSVRSLTRTVLQSCGYAVLESADGNDALRVAWETEAPIHLLVSDVVMPGLGGRELAEQLLVLHPQMKVLFLSGYTDDAVVRHGILHERVNFLQKPFSTVALARKVREVLDTPPASEDGPVPLP